MLISASHMIMPPYWAVTAGPISHSPPPIAAPAISSPGPRIPNNPFRSRGGSGSSPSVHAGIFPLPLANSSGGASATTPGGDSAMAGFSGAGVERPGRRLRFGHRHLAKGLPGGAPENQ